MRRVLSKGEDGVRIGYLEWESVTLIEASAALAQSEPSVVPLLDTVNLKSMDLRCFDIRLQNGLRG